MSIETHSDSDEVFAQVMEEMDMWEREQMWAAYGIAAPVTIEDAHSQWHAIHGRYAICPMDCGVAEHLMEEIEPDTLIFCGHCKEYHLDVASVRACAAMTYELCGIEHSILV